MGFQLNRAFVLFALLGAGLLVALGDDAWAGAKIALAGLVYWKVAGWVGRWRGTRHPRARPKGADVVTVIEHRTHSDGVGGAFARLHPETRAWLENELRARGAASQDRPSRMR